MLGSTWTAWAPVIFNKHIKMKRTQVCACGLFYLWFHTWSPFKSIEALLPAAVYAEMELIWSGRNEGSRRKEREKMETKKVSERDRKRDRCFSSHWPPPCSVWSSSTLQNSCLMSHPPLHPQSHLSTIHPPFFRSPLAAAHQFSILCQSYMQPVMF